MRVYLTTHGCRANQYDSAAVGAMVTAGGHHLVAQPEGADVAIFNSCAVTADAVADLRQAVRRAARREPSIRNVIIGCAAALDRGEIRALPNVDQVLGGAPFDDIARVLGLDPALARGRPSAQGGTRALLRIQDGCDEHCTFCATTLARGGARSRAADELVREAEQLAAHHAEIVLTGVHIGSYGVDCASSLGALLARLVACVPGVRFRLSSIEATELDDRLVALLTGNARCVAPWLHAPLQSGSDRVLRRMGRHWYTAAQYAEAIERVAAAAPVLGLGADVIAGFPGETDSDHEATVTLVASLPFTALHVFSYSSRPGTAAARFGNAVPAAVVRRRAQELRALGERGTARHRAARAGGPADVIVLGGVGARDGLTEDHLTVRMRDARLPRGARVDAHLEFEGATLFARTEAV